MIDLHTHILPGLDDGARDMDEALRMAEAALEGGVSRLVATPHFKRDEEGKIDFDSARESLDRFRLTLDQKGLALNVCLGAEIPIFHDLLSVVLEHGPKMTVGKGSYLIMEFPFGFLHSGIQNLLFRLKLEGYNPIIAHPERNAVLRRRPDLLEDMIRMGMLCQINSGSLIGTYGSEVRSAAFCFLRMKMAHFLASDCHGTGSLRPNLDAAAWIVRNSFGERMERALVMDNPLAVMNNKPVPYCPRPEKKEQKPKSITIRIPSFLKRL